MRYIDVTVGVLCEDQKGVANQTIHNPCPQLFVPLVNTLTPVFMLRIVFAERARQSLNSLNQIYFFCCNIHGANVKGKQGNQKLHLHNFNSNHPSTACHLTASTQLLKSVSQLAQGGRREFISCVHWGNASGRTQDNSGKNREKLHQQNGNGSCNTTRFLVISIGLRP